MILDGKNMIFGRFSVEIARKLMNNEEISVINAEKIIILGDPQRTFEKYLELRQKGDVFKGPFFPKRPDDIFKRTVKGMLPKNRMGRKYLKNLKVYIGTPDGMKGEKLEQKPIKTNFISLGELSKKLGWSQ